MRKNIACLLVLIIFQLPATSQSRVQFLVSGGPTFTPGIKYYNCTGHINNAMTGSLSVIYRPISAFGIELKYSSLLHPKSYLNNDTNNMVKVYTTTHIIFQRILTGFNYYLPLNKIKPFIGLLAGASYVEENQAYPYSSLVKYNWGFQVGASININKHLAIQLDASDIYIPNVPDNSTFFGNAADGTGFPSFIIGNPSKTTIVQWNINIGLLIILGKRNR